MATEAQLAANRLNAIHHGLASVLAEGASGRELVEARKGLWRPEFKPDGETQEGLFEQVVVESLRVERCQGAYFSLCNQHGERAKVQWDADRRREAETLASDLARNPRLLSAQLEATVQGCNVKLELWAGLLSSLTRHRIWTDKQRSLALDLLGVHSELRDAETTLDPSLGDLFETRSAVVNAEVVRLANLRDGALAGLDAHDRAFAETTLGAELTAPLQLLDRYERAALRRQNAAWRKLNAAKVDAASPAPAIEIEASAPNAKLEPKPLSLPEPMPVRPLTLERRSEYVAQECPEHPIGLNRQKRRAIAALQRRAG